MKAELQHERTAVRASGSNRAPRGGGGRWAFIAISLVVVALAIGAFTTLHGSTGTSQSHAVYLDPMTGAREGGPYARPVVGRWVDALTRFREGSGYPTTSSSDPIGAVTGVREAGPYATSWNPGAMTSAREAGPYATPVP